MEYRLEPQPALTVDEDLVKATAEVTKTEDIPEDVLMDTIHHDPPLPTARIEYQGSVLEFVLDAKVAPDPPPTIFSFEDNLGSQSVEELKTVAPSQTLYTLPAYTLPPLKALPPEFHRKGKQRQSRKRDKDKIDGKSSQEWTPLGLNKWSAMLRANPVHKRVNKSTKCLSTREWNVCEFCVRTSPR
jgi:chromatin modification-related protein VID21